MTIKKDLKIYSANLLHLIFGEVKRYFEDINGNKYLRLVPTNKSKQKTKKFEEMRIKIRDLTRSITRKSDDYDDLDEKYMRIKVDTDDKLLLNKTIETPLVTIVVRAIFHKNNKYHPQVCLDKFPCEI